jgi:hypothetical protein
MHHLFFITTPPFAECHYALLLSLFVLNKCQFAAAALYLNLTLLDASGQKTYFFGGRIYYHYNFELASC